MLLLCSADHGAYTSASVVAVRSAYTIHWPFGEMIYDVLRNAHERLSEVSSLHIPREKRVAYQHLTTTRREIDDVDARRIGREREAEEAQRVAVEKQLRIPMTKLLSRAIERGFGATISVLGPPSTDMRRNEPLSARKISDVLLGKNVKPVAPCELGTICAELLDRSRTRITLTPFESSPTTPTCRPLGESSTPIFPNFPSAKESAAGTLHGQRHAESYIALRRTTPISFATQPRYACEQHSHS